MPPTSKPKTFGEKCAARIIHELPALGLLPGAGAYIAVVIDSERAALIAAAAKTPDASDPRLHTSPSGTRPPGSPPSAPSTVEDFGDRKKIPPNPEQVTRYFAHIGYPISGEEFCDFYAAKGWKVGDAKMKDWQAAARNWKRSGWGHLSTSRHVPNAQRRYDKF